MTLIFSSNVSTLQAFFDGVPGESGAFHFADMLNINQLVVKCDNKLNGPLFTVENLLRR